MPATDRDETPAGTPRSRRAGAERSAGRRLLARMPTPLLVIAGGLALAAIALATFHRLAALTTFIASAETELVEATTARALPVSWWLEGAHVCSGVSRDTPRRPGSIAQAGAARGPAAGGAEPGASPATTTHDCPGSDGTATLVAFSGHLDLASVVDVTLERLSTGPLAIAIRAIEGGEPFGVRVRPLPPGEAIHLEPPVYIHVDEPGRLSAHGRPISLPLLASTLSLGRESATQGIQAQPLLREGKLTVLGRTMLGRRTYPAEVLDLTPGDRLTADPAAGGVVSCLVRVDERPALQSIVRVEAASLAIRGFYSEPQAVELSLLDRLAHDRLVAATLSLIGIAATLLATWTGLPNHWKGPSA